MYFTQEDYKKIETWLKRNSVKDSEFLEALPLMGREYVTIVQDGHNRKVFVKDFADQLSTLGIVDFINVTYSYNAPNISLREAISLIPDKARKEGQLITFLNGFGKWEMYQFIGELNQWNNTTLWQTPFSEGSETSNPVTIEDVEKSVNKAVIKEVKIAVDKETEFLDNRMSEKIMMLDNSVNEKIAENSQLINNALLAYEMPIKFLAGIQEDGREEFNEWLINMTNFSNKKGSYKVVVRNIVKGEIISQVIYNLSTHTNAEDNTIDIIFTLNPQFIGDGKMVVSGIKLSGSTLGGPLTRTSVYDIYQLVKIN